LLPSWLDTDFPSQQVLDLSSIISGWFDTTNAGMKHDSSSYERIAKDLNVCPVGVTVLTLLTDLVDACLCDTLPQ